MTSVSLDQQLAELAARQYGVFSRAQAQRLGAARGVLARRLSAGRWEREGPYVFRLHGVPRSWRQTLMTASLTWGEGATISHRSAAALVRLPGCEQEVVELTVPKHRRGTGPGIVHRNLLLAVDRTTIDGIPVTTTARTLIDIAAVSPRETVEEALDDALRRKMVSIPRLRWRLAEVGRPGRSGVAVMRALLDARETTGVPQSVFESKLLRTIQTSGLPQPVLQHRVRDGSRLIAVVDFAFPANLVAVEADGYRWHSGRAPWQHDLTRRNRLTSLGWRVVHVTWTDLVEQPEVVIESIRRTLASS